MIELNGKGRIDFKETLRYLGYFGGEGVPELEKELVICEKLLVPELAPKACAEVYPITISGDTLDLGFCKTQSRALAKNLEGCERIALFAATVGAGADRLIMKYGKISPARSLVLQAMGSSAAECWCDDVNAIIKHKFGRCRPRFSCGYGDFRLEVQRDIFSALSVTKRLGVTLSDNLFMVPTKSVTAIIGIL